jgi:hypothetical protein
MDTAYGAQFGTFSGYFGNTFGEIHKLTSLPIFISETNLASLGSSGYESITSFMKDLFADGGSGVLEWEDGSQHMSAAQWSELDAALANAPGGTPPPGEEQPGNAGALAGVHDSARRNGPGPGRTALPLASIRHPQTRPGLPISAYAR